VYRRFDKGARLRGDLGSGLFELVSASCQVLASLFMFDPMCAFLPSIVVAAPADMQGDVRE
jgi:hypothetical protein